LQEALACCDRLLKLDPVDPAAHHLRATIALELCDLGAARSSLRRAVYLHPDFILAHVALGNLAARERGAREAGKHFDTARRLLAQLPPEAMVAGAEGMTAGALTAAISSLGERSK
jgi:chemotaxis protein methyltransferase CheR